MFYKQLKMSTYTYTCITCHVTFPHAEMQRQHYKTDWHRYNLKRKVVRMPPVTATTFQDKVKEHKVTSDNDKEAEGISGFCCKLCQKRFGSHKAFENHRNSKKHRARETSHIEENMSRDGDGIREKGDVLIEDEIKVQKMLADAKADMEKPKIIRSADTKTARAFASGDNPRMQWFKKQAKALEETEDNEDGWEDMEEDGTDEEAEMVEDATEVDEDADVESLSSEAISSTSQRHIPVNECLFCFKNSKTMESNIIHMSKKHGFFVPDLNFVIDLDGLLNYLGEKVGVGNVCLWCNEKGKAFYSMSAAAKHMRDKGHCNLLFGGDAALEYADFYDFGEMNDDDMDFEDDETTEMPSGEESQELELVLPSGASIGHRALMKYYKQKFPTVDRSSTKKQRTLTRLLSRYRALGWHGGVHSPNNQMQKDLAFLKHKKTKYQLKLSVNNNKTMMKHYRSQILM